MRAGPVSPAGFVQLLGSVTLLSCAWPITKIAVLQGVTPAWFAWGRAGFSCATVFAVLGALGRLRRPVRRDLPALVVVGAFQLAGFFALAHAALAFVPAGRTAVLSNVTTIWLAPLSVLVLHEAVPRPRWIAAGLGLAGVTVLMGPWAIDWGSASILIGNAFLLGAALCWAIAMVAVRRFPPGLTMLELLPWSFLLATVLLAPLALSSAAGPGIWTTKSILAMAYIGLIAGPVGTWCALQVALTLPVMVASVGFLATPATGLLLSAWWLAEPITPDLWLGSVLILVGVAIATLMGGRR